MDFCPEHIQTKEALARLEQKTADTCRNIDSVKKEVNGLDSRVNKRITETSVSCDKRIDDTMASIRRLFLAIMVSILGSGVGFIIVVMRLYDKVK